MQDNELITIYKKIFISSAHSLKLNYESKCNRLHGHNYTIEIWITGKLDSNGMVMDFYHIKNEVMKLDHINLNDVLNPSTAENIAIYLSDKIYNLSNKTLNKIKVKVWETNTAYAEFTKLNSD